jgi:type I restriction-modification system DNA methylase subunit
MTNEQTKEIRRRLDENLSLDDFERDYRSTGEAATQFFQDLFVQVLNFEETTSPLGDATWQDIPVHEWPNTARANAARLFAESGNFRVIYVELEKLTRTAERNAIQSLTRSDRTSGWAIDGSFLTVFHAPDEDIWHLVTPYEEGTDDITAGRAVLRRYTLGEGETHRTVANALSSMDASKGRLAERIDEAFRVKPVTEDFYENYKSAFDTLSKELRRKGLEIEDADRYAHTMLNRLMFFYYLQKKGWIGDRKDFVRWFHQQYEESNEEDVFHEKWLSALFFEGMNSPEGGEIDADLSSEVGTAIVELPYMNGGLFQPTEEDERDTFLSDSALKSVIEEFLEQYNFTVTEESPYDIDVAVDPAMLGKIYESLIAEQERGEAGIFYTPRVEVDLMCRMALYEQFCDHANDLDSEGKQRIVEFIFSEPQDWDAESSGETEQLENILHELSIVDPACGSGAFLVGMKQVLTELYRKLGTTPDYHLKEQIINENLYGVDIKDWAVRVAEFRLWLSLVEGEDKIPEQRPVLPNFSFKLHTGDSIIQKIGDDFFSIEDIGAVSGETQDHIEELENLKERHFEGGSDLSEEVQQKQIEVVTSYIDHRIDDLQETSSQSKLGGGITEESSKRQQQAEQQVQRLKELKDSVAEASEGDFFLWDLDFPGVMLEGGFDIVIANPPYVDHQNIIRQDLTQEMQDEMDSSKVQSLKTSYKNDLVEYVRQEFDIKAYKRSDLYLYFFFKSIDILRDQGTLMFITSNTWLDTSYGKRLQQGLLELTDLKHVIDNRKRRSFENADVNTVITAANKNTERYLEGDVQFAAFRKPYEQIGTPDDMTKLLVDSAGGESDEFAVGNDRGKINRFNELRSVGITEEVLWRLGEGTISESQETLDEAAKSSDRTKPGGTYKGNKWGQFLRAPSAHFDLLEAGSNVLVPLSEIAEVGSYLNTGGADDFFFVDLSSGDPEEDDLVVVRNRETGDTFEVESEFVVPFVESPGQIKQIDVSNNEFDSHIISIPKEADIKSKKIGEYVKWGEGDGREYDQASGRKNKDEWWVLGQRAETNTEVVWPNRQNDRHFVAYNPQRTVTHRFYRIKPKEGVNLTSKELAALLNFSPTSLFTEVLASAGLGQGVLDVTGTTLRRVPVVDPKSLSEDVRTRILDSFDEMAERTMGSMHQELGSESSDSIDIDSVKEDRRDLDKAIFEDCFNIDTDAQLDAYSAILRTINERINKSQSV